MGQRLQKIIRNFNILGPLVVTALLAFPAHAFGCGGDLESSGLKADLTAKIRGLAGLGVSAEIVQTLLRSLERFPEKWKLIGYELVEATRLTNLIERNATKVFPEMVPLDRLSTTHKISTPYDLQKLRERADELRKHLPLILSKGYLDAEMRRTVIPSEAAALRVARDPGGNYYVFDGNGRTQALREALANQGAGIKIDVLVYEISDLKIVEQIQISSAIREGSAF